MNGTKVCKGCGEEKSLDDFPMIRKRWYDPECRPCKRLRGKRWREANSEKHKDNCRQWYRNNRERSRVFNEQWHVENPLYNRHNNTRRRAREHGVEFEDVNLVEVVEESDYICGICGLFVDEDKWNIDHIIPLSSGGAHRRDNLQISHPRCNRQKLNRVGWTPYERPRQELEN